MMDRKQVEIASQICDRAIAGYPEGYRDKLSMMMDVEFANEDIPMDLQKLLDFPYGDFFHDMNGIIQNLNRDTKKIENFFCPRSAYPACYDPSDNLSSL